MSFYSTVARTAKRERGCDSCHIRIKPGDRYLVHTEFPGGDAGYADAAGHPVRMAECASCATRYDRGPLLVAS